jgi:hypothetical protein
MKTVHTLLKAVAVSAIMLPATLANAATSQQLTITNVSGAARIQQPLPCGQNLDLTSPIAEGLVGLSWLQQERGEVLIDLARLTMMLSPFHVEANCNGVGGSVEFREIGVHLASAVRFTAQPVSPRTPYLVRFRIPKEQFLIRQAVVDNAPFPQPESIYRKPSEDVTGLIDLRGQTVQLHVVLAPELRFRAGCIDNRCAIDESHKGVVTTDVRGGNFTGAPPSIACRPSGRAAHTFAVSAIGNSTLALGDYTLGNNEVIRILPAGQPGVRLLPSNRGDGVRQFQAGPGDAFIVATDPANSPAIAYCR